MTNNLDNILSLSDFYNKAASIRTDLENNYIIAKTYLSGDTEIVYKTSSLSTFIWFVLTHLPNLVKQRVNLKYGDTARKYLLLHLKEKFDEITKNTSTIKLNDKNIVQFKEIETQLSLIMKNFNSIYPLPKNYSKEIGRIKLVIQQVENFKKTLEHASKKTLIKTDNIQEVIDDFKSHIKNIGLYEKLINDNKYRFDEEFTANLKNETSKIRKNFNDQLKNHPTVKQLYTSKNKFLEEQVKLKEQYTKLDEKIKADPLWKEIKESSLEKYRDSLKTKRDTISAELTKTEKLTVRKDLDDTLTLLEIEIEDLDSFSKEIEDLSKLKADLDKISANLSKIDGDLKLVEKARK